MARSVRQGKASGAKLGKMRMAKAGSVPRGRSTRHGLLGSLCSALSAATVMSRARSPVTLLEKKTNKHGSARLIEKIA